MRNKDKCLEKEIIQGSTSGARAKGRPKTSWLGNIRLWTGLTMEELLRTVEVHVRLLFGTCFILLSTKYVCTIVFTIIYNNLPQRWKIVVYDTVTPRIEDD